MTKKVQHFLLFGGIFLVVGIFSFLAWRFSTEDIVVFVGEEHAYAILFLSALLGGTSLFIPFPYYLLTFSFGALGISPLLLGIVAASGTALGDATTYYFGRKGRVFASSRMQAFFSRMLQTLTEKYPRFIPIGAFCYASVIPLPDDLIMVPMGVIKYPFWRIMPSLFLGKIVFNTILAFAGWYGWEFFSQEML